MGACRILALIIQKGQTIASSNDVTLVSRYCWEYTKIGLNSGFRIFPDPSADQKSRSTLALENLHDRSTRLQNWGDLHHILLYYIILDFTMLHCTILYCTLYSILYTLYFHSILYTPYSILYTLYSILFTLYSILYTLYSILYAILYYIIPCHTIVLDSRIGGFYLLHPPSSLGLMATKTSSDSEPALYKPHTSEKNSFKEPYDSRLRAL